MRPAAGRTISDQTSGSTAERRMTMSAEIFDGADSMPRGWKRPARGPAASLTTSMLSSVRPR